MNIRIGNTVINWNNVCSMTKHNNANTVSQAIEFTFAATYPDETEPLCERIILPSEGIRDEVFENIWDCCESGGDNIYISNK